ncbi:unnamed protein product [Mytilus edulis]|uniref:Uncharacterized protein n=1 Tax=Mytilus edulis TaxID=6550 RepID=A0A8S3QJS3_MYTED|nr:unnamed protein product [Mytilus edulis]
MDKEWKWGLNLIHEHANDEARMKEDSKKHTQIRSLLVDVGSESSIHGISRIVSDRPIFLRLLWLIAFFVALSFGLYQVYTIIHLFLKYSVKTNVEVRYSPIAFPAITICNMNIIKKSESGNLGNQNLQRILNGSSSYTSTLPTLLPTLSTTTPPGTHQPTTTTTQSSLLDLPNIIPTEVTIPDLNLNLSTLLDDNILSDFYGSSDLLQPEAGKLQDDYIAYQNFKDEYQKLKRHIKVQVGHQIENMLLECTYAGHKCDRPSKHIVTPDYGNCYTLQSRRYISGTSGPVGGMTLTINLENHEAIETMTEGFGLRLTLHEVGSFPLPLERGMTISGGFETSLALKLITQVIADIGGSLGLCIGVSLLCVFEAVEAIVGVLLVIKRKIQGHTRVKAQFD